MDAKMWSFQSPVQPVLVLLFSSRIDMVAFLLRALLLCGLQGGALSLSGLCTENLCYALLVEPKDFQGARKSCRDSDGDLLRHLDVEAQRHLLSGLSGTFWFGPSVAQGQNCPSCSVGQGGNVTIQTSPCSAHLSGYICQYPNAEPCSGVSLVGAAQVGYTAPMGFALNTSRLFPRGTVAVAWGAEALHPDAKFLCFQSTWLRAPWNCEVMGGGCQHACNKTTGSCACPQDERLHVNLFTCSRDTCGGCAHLCATVGGSHACKCHAGYALAPDWKSCEDVDECERPGVCVGADEECVNTRGGFECRCKDGFEKEEEVCVDVSICDKCEHMRCVKSNGTYACACNEGFRVSPIDPTKCEMFCDQKDCLANCIPNPEGEERNMHACFCPEGYVKDIRNKTAFCTDIDECDIRLQCQHICKNLFGSYVCSCNDGYELFDGYMCVHPEDDKWTPAYPTPAESRPAALPSYVKAGSALGIGVFLLLCMVVLYFVVRNMAKRCGSLEFPSLKASDMDPFYLQQVTTETYKRLSFDRQSKCDSQRL
ncbi:thrombomodulin-like [Syngnathoides biaculeatus]|uniref:thrombomodulin-like n=1 Tax=Syngnathoides biaculeatus TaxID=300417 RepID=UPI002ADE56C9|nr:thrombomodulin-like [Syngnathoides biaculeatus]